MRTLGFIGTGAIAAAFIEGFVTAGRASPILVSPRSEHLSEGLARRFDTVSRTRSNAEVAQKSDVVFLAIRPAQVEEALRGIDFRPGQIVCSFVTGLSVQDLGAIAPTATVCRVLPLPAIAMRKGPLIHYPRVPQIMELIDGLGDIVLPGTEAELVAMGGVSGFMSSFLELQSALAGWLEGRGVAADAANLYTRSIFSGLSETALRSDKTLVELTDEHQTKGGLNERTRNYLAERKWFAEPGLALDAVQQLSRKQLK